MKTLNFNLDFGLLPEMVERSLQLILMTYDAAAHSSILNEWKDREENWLAEVRLQVSYLGTHGINADKTAGGWITLVVYKVKPEFL